MFTEQVADTLFSFPFFFQAELAECLERDGFKSVQEAVGADCRWNFHNSQEALDGSKMLRAGGKLLEQVSPTHLRKYINLPHMRISEGAAILLSLNVERFYHGILNYM